MKKVLAIIAAVAATLAAAGVCAWRKGAKKV